MPILSIISPGIPSSPGAGRRYQCMTACTQWALSPLSLTIGKNLLLILTWYILSTFLSIFNKILLGKEHGLLGQGAFPAPLFMSGVQFGMQFLLAKLVFFLGIMQRTPKPVMTWVEHFRTVVPTGVTTALDIGLSNMSLVYITMSFYTMCKSTVPVFLLLFAFIWRIEKPSWELAGVVGVISSGLLLLVEGEADFHVLGFSLVMTASCLSGVRFTLTQVFLHGHHGTVALGGPLEVLELLTPIMSATMLLLSVAWEQLWVVLPVSPYFASLNNMGITCLVILAGAHLAFFMVWTEYQVIKETSALTFMIAGTCKEVVTVVVAVIVFGDRFGSTNGLGLGVVILGVLLFNWHKYRRMITENPLGTVRKHRQVKDEDVEASPQVELEPLVITASSNLIPGAAGLSNLGGSSGSEGVPRGGGGGSRAGGGRDQVPLLGTGPSCEHAAGTASFVGQKGVVGSQPSSASGQMSARDVHGSEREPLMLKQSQ